MPLGSALGSGSGGGASAVFGVTGAGVFSAHENVAIPSTIHNPQKNDL